MRHTELRRLAEYGGICGTKLRTGRNRHQRLCLLRPGHDGPCRPMWDRGPLTREDKLIRALAKKSALAESRDRSERHLHAIIEARERRIAWMESFVGFRIEYRIRGLYRRLRRYYRFGKSRLA